MSSIRDGDRLIAKKIMGGFVEEPDALTEENREWYWVHPRSGVLRGEPYEIGDGKLFDHSWKKFSPFTDYVDAFRVVHKLREGDWWMDLRHVLSQGKPAMQCTFSYIPHMAPDRRVIATANDELAAIGIAALRVAGVDEDTIFAAVNAAENLAKED